jgi:hypothetical protein
MPNRYFLDRIAGYDSSIRAADADRERVAERLRKSHAEGRLDMAEFQERLERCYEAKTQGELGELVGDLPREEQQTTQRSLARLLPPRPGLVPLVPILIALFIVAAVLSGHHIFWLWIPLGFLIWRTSWWRRRRWFAGARRGPGYWT